MRKSAALLALAFLPAAASAGTHLEICHYGAEGMTSCFSLDSACSGEIHRGDPEHGATCELRNPSRCSDFAGMIESTFERIRGRPAATRHFADAKHPAPIACNAYSISKGEESVWSCIDDSKQADTTQIILRAMKRLAGLCK